MTQLKRLEKREDFSENTVLLFIMEKKLKREQNKQIDVLNYFGGQLNFEKFILGHFIKTIKKLEKIPFENYFYVAGVTPEVNILEPNNSSINSYVFPYKLSIKINKKQIMDEFDYDLFVNEYKDIIKKMFMIVNDEDKIMINNSYTIQNAIYWI